MELLLFDLGGVLIKNNGNSIIKRLSANKLTDEEIKIKWFNSSAVKQFESGLISKYSFAKRMVKDY